jgi:formylglycine-generating enzyme required for sulfatase activity
VLSAGEAFRDCDGCPEMVVVPAGSFLMGSPDDEAGRQADEGPRHEVRFAVPFAIGRNEVTFAEWDACVADGGCDGYSPADAGWGRGERPVINVSWLEARTYAAWLSEWEYAARGGTTTPYAFGTALGPAEANVAGERTVPVGSHEANGFGLLDMHGNVWEWVEDCYADSYAHAPADGAAVSPPGCDWRVVRGGAWNTRAVENMRSAFRFRRIATSSRDSVGFRVARGLGSDARASQADPP